MKTIIFKLTIMLLFFSSLTLSSQVNLHDTIFELNGGYSIIRIYSDNGFFSDYLTKGSASELDISTGMNTISELDENEEDILGGTLWLPDTTSGVLPMDVLYNDPEDKFYYIGNRRLMIVDAITDYTIKSITISSYANIFATQASLTNPYSNFLAYNPNTNTVYCATFGNELLFIDGQTDEISQTFTEYNMGDQLSTSIVFNASTNRLYWLINSWISAKIRMFDFNTQQQYEYTLSEQIGDMVCDTEGDYLYISTGSSVKTLGAADLSVLQSFATEKTGVLLYDNINSTLYCQINTDGPGPGNLYYFNHQGQNLGTLFTGLTFVTEKAYRKDNNNNISESKIYFSGVTNNSYVIKVINGETHEISTIYPGTTYYSMVFNQTSDKLFCGGYNKVASYSGNSSALVDQATIKGCTSRKLEFIPENTSQIASLNTLEGTICNIAENCQPSHFRSIGMCSYKACYNDLNNYAYFAQSESKYEDGIISVYDGDNQWIKTIGEVGKYITSIVYNKESNRIFVACYDDGVVTVIGGNTNTIFTKISFLSPYRSIYPRVLLSYGEYVYVGGSGGIAVITASSCAWQDLGTTEGIPTDIDKDEEHPSVYITYALGSSDIYKIAHTPPAFEIAGSINLGGANPVGVRYHPQNDRLYVANNGAKNVMVFNTELVQQATIQFGYPLKYIEKDTYRNRVYALGYWATNGYIPEIDIINNSLVSTYVTNRSEGLIYNPVNDRVQTSRWYEEYGKDVSVNTIDCYDNSFNSTQVGNKMSSFAFINTSIISRSDPFFNQTKNLMYFGNNGFSNASVIQCYNDELPLKSDITWLSFPRMQRYLDDNTETDPILKRIDWYPQVGFHLDGWPQPGDQLQSRFFYSDPPTWTGLLTEVKSSSGYKLDFDPSELPSPKITLHGAIVPPETPVTLYGGGKQNWTGYFLKNSQWVAEAIPSELYNHFITSITTQYWSKTKIGGSWVQSGKETPLKYGDMVILRMNYPGEKPLIWNNPENSAEDKIIPETEFYTFEEQLDYTPFYIETEAVTDTKEMAVVVEGECLGATVCNPGDTLIEIDAYINNLPQGSVVEFETWDGYKSSYVQSGQYIVYNPLSNIKEKRKIFIGEAQDYYLVSFRNDETFHIPGQVSDLNCQPNPVQEGSIISFRVNQSCDIKLGIYDIHGKEIIILREGNIQEGYYRLAYEMSNIGTGVYILRLSGNNGEVLVKKLVSDQK